MVPSAAVALGVAGAGGAYPARVVGARGTRPVCAPAPTGTKRVLVRTRAWSETAKSSKCSPPPSADARSSDRPSPGDIFPRPASSLTPPTQQTT